MAAKHRAKVRHEFFFDLKTLMGFLAQLFRAICCVRGDYAKEFNLPVRSDRLFRQFQQALVSFPGGSDAFHGHNQTIYNA
jgi:hypothetical protein